MTAINNYILIERAGYRLEAELVDGHVVTNEVTLHGPTGLLGHWDLDEIAADVSDSHNDHTTAFNVILSLVGRIWREEMEEEEEEGTTKRRSMRRMRGAVDALEPDEYETVTPDPDLLMQADRIIKQFGVECGTEQALERFRQRLASNLQKQRWSAPRQGKSQDDWEKYIEAQTDIEELKLIARRTSDSLAFYTNEHHFQQDRAIRANKELERIKSELMDIVIPGGYEKYKDALNNASVYKSRNEDANKRIRELLDNTHELNKSD